MKQVLILMTTYNGEKYLKEQLDSILFQSYNSWHLIISDDGSTDGTLRIIDEVITLYPDKIDFIKNESNFHGARENFYLLIKYAQENMPDYQYYCFCDQDDIWKSEKLEHMLKAAEVKNKTVPTLLFHNMEIVDGNGKSSGKTIGELTGLKNMNPLSVFYSFQPAYGCSMLLNNKLFLGADIPSFNQYIPMHDVYYECIAALSGEVYYVNEVLSFYRRHGSNVSSNEVLTITRNRVGHALVKFKKHMEIHRRMYDGALILINEIRVKCKLDYDVEKLDAIEHSIKNGGIKSAFFLIKEKLNMGRFERTVSHAISLLLKSTLTL